CRVCLPHRGPHRGHQRGPDRGRRHPGGGPAYAGAVHPSVSRNLVRQDIGSAQVQSFWTPIRVGLVVAAAAAAFGIGLWLIGADLSGRNRTYAVYAIFDDATGLGVRSRVQIAGIPVGQVDRVELDQRLAKAKVWLRIKKDFILHRDATITKRSESILGDFLLDLTPGSAGEPPLKDGDEIRNVVRQPSMN